MGVPSPPILKKNFFADFHYLGHERKKIEKSVEMTQICPDPPPKCEISHFLDAIASLELRCVSQSV